MEKIFLVLYVYVVVLFVINIAYIILSILQSDRYIRSWSLSIGSTVPCRTAHAIVKKISFADWFLLTLVQANTDTLLFHAFIELYLEEKERTKTL